MPFKKNSFFNTSRATVILVSLAMIIAFLAFTGWVLNIEFLRKFNYNWPSIKANSALGIIFSGFSLFLFIRGNKWLGLFFAAIVFLLGLISFSEHNFHFNAHIDELLFYDKETPTDKNHGRMPQLTSIAFIIIGIALLTYSSERKWAQKLSRFSILLVIALSFAGFIGSLYNAGQLFRTKNIASFSIPTALCGLLMSIGILFSKPVAFLSVFQRQTLTARAGIRGIFFIIIILIVIGWLCQKGENAGIFDPAMASVILITTFTISFLIIVLTGIQRLNQSEDQLVASEKNLRHVLSSTANVYYVIDKDYKITLINEMAKKNLTMAWGKPVKAGANILDLIPDNKNEPIQQSFKKVFQGEKIEYELHQSTWQELPEWVLVSYKPVINNDGTVTGAYIVTKDITISKKAEEELRKSEQRYRSLIEQASDYIMITDSKGNFIDVNSSLCKTFGYTREELLSRNISQIIDPIQLKNDPIRFDLLLQGQSMLRERRMMNKDGTIIEVEANVKMLPDGRILAIARDIAERKKAEEELKRSEERYRSLVENATEALVVFDVEQKKFVSVSESAARLFKMSKEELLKIGPVDVSPEYQLDGRLSSEAAIENISKAISGQKPSFEWMHKDSEGKLISCEVWLVLLPAVNQTLIRGTIIDISERKKAEQLIKTEKELSDSIINSMPGIFYLFDENEKYLRWNKLKEIITGYSNEEIKKMSPLDFFENGEKENVRQHIEEGFRTGETKVEASITTKDGKNIPFFFTGIAIEYEGKSCLLGTGINISDRKKAEQEVQQSYIAIRQLTEHLQNIREEERTHIAREIHDELGQQLTVLKMDASWLNKKLSSADESVKQKLKDLLELLDGTVRTVRKISSELRPSLLDDMGLVAAMEWHLNEFEKRVAIKTNFSAPQHDLVLSDTIKTGLFRIFQESLTNVARHSNAKEVEIRLQQQNGNIVLSIKDDGKGFDKEKAANKKTLGILGMEERSFMMGGSYQINSKPGKGTLVVVSVPYKE